MAEDITKKGGERRAARARLLDEAERIVYRETEDASGEAVALEAYMFAPGPGVMPVTKGGSGRSAILFFFSSCWDAGTVTQFAPQCMHFARRGMVAVAFDYRVSSRQGTGPLEAIEDAQAAIRWVRENADHFGVDPERVVVAGGSGGAYLGLMAMLTNEDVPSSTFQIPKSGSEGDAGLEDEEDFASCHPDGLVLFSPIVDVTEKGCGTEKFTDGKFARMMSPVHLLQRRDTPPTIVFHAEGDRRVPIVGVRKFASKMRMRRGVCELVKFGKVDHSFFNLNVDERLFEVVLEAADDFLVRMGFIDDV